MKLDKIIEGTYHLIFENNKNLNDSVARIFAPEGISKKELDVWHREEYLKNKEYHLMHGCFLYKEDLDSFYNKNKKSLLNEELKMYDFLKNKEFENIVVSSNESMNGTLEHEVAHLLYESNYEYRLRVTELIDKIPKKTKNQMKRHLEEIGYSSDSDIFYDESQACIIGHVSSFKENGVDFSKSKKIIKKLKENFDNHFY